MAIRYLFAGLPVARLDPALAWYERFVGRAAGPVETAPGLYRKADVSDPDGNVLQVARVLSATEDPRQGDSVAS
jgi:hypothetical protein